MHCTTRSILDSVFSSVLHRPSALPPSFLAPSFIVSRIAPFSSSPTANARNLNRGVSALHHTKRGRGKKLPAKVVNLPKPVLDPAKHTIVEVSEDHGLWDFFNQDRASLHTPRELQAHGRGWTVPELRKKDWDDLWRLWWVCVKEKNRLATFMLEKERIGQLFGAGETHARMRQIKLTQVAIKHVLTERWYAWENARYAAMEDPEVNLYADPSKGEPAYVKAPRVRQDAVTPVIQSESLKKQETVPPPPNEKPIRPQASV